MAANPRSFDASGVSPPDAIVTLRSLRRRFAEAFERADNPADLSRRSDDGRTPLEHAASTTTAFETIGSALRKVLLSEHPLVELPAVDPSGSAGTGGNLTGASVLAALGDTAGKLADTMADAHGEDWSRSGQSATGEVSALDIARLAVQIGINHLRAAERAIGEKPS